MNFDPKVSGEDFNKLTVGELGKLFPIKLVDHNPVWRERFLVEQHNILQASGTDTILRIEHIGSTAMPGICAKPIIDILIEIKNETDLDSLLSNLHKIKYQYIPKPENPPPHIMLAKGYSRTDNSEQKFHIHVRYSGDWDEIVFRDYLIANAKTAIEYAALKMKLAIKYENDREKYTEGKTAFVKQVIKLARS
ncbi:MAG: GrpB family protein [Bacteroidia bacterium]|nr:GrpB family protein [Bacteroidia bacterium]